MKENRHTNTAISMFTTRASNAQDLVYDLRVKLNGLDRFFILKVHPAKHAAFLRTVEHQGGMTLESFGEILHRGFGEPDDALKATLSQSYGFVYA